MAYDDVRKNFQTKMKQKIYWAIVDGDFDRDGTWSHHFQPSGAKGAKQKVSLDPQHNSTEGTLTVKKVMSENGKSLVMVKLESGLRHQIRAQLSAACAESICHRWDWLFRSSRIGIHVTHLPIGWRLHKFFRY